MWLVCHQVEANHSATFLAVEGLLLQYDQLSDMVHHTEDARNAAVAAAHSVLGEHQHKMHQAYHELREMVQRDSHEIFQAAKRSVQAEINLNVSAALGVLQAQHTADLLAMQSTCAWLTALVCASIVLSLIMCLRIPPRESFTDGTSYPFGGTPRPSLNPLRRSFGSRDSFYSRERADSTPLSERSMRSTSSFGDSPRHDDSDTDSDFEQPLSDTPRESMHFKRGTRQQRLWQARRRGSMGSLGGAKLNEMLALPHELRKSTTDSNLSMTLGKYSNFL